MSIDELRDALTRAATPSDVYDTVVDLGVSLAGATAGSVALLDPLAAWVDVVASRGYTPEALERFGRMAADADLPLAASVRSGQTLVEDVSVALERYDGLQPTDIADDRKCVACIPLEIGPQVIGALGFSFDRPAEAVDVGLLEEIGDISARAIERTVSSTPEGVVYRRMLEAARGRLAFVSAATRELSRSLDQDAVLQTLTQLVVPRFADWASVLLPEGEELVAATLVHKALPVDDLRERAGRFRTPITADTPSGEVYRTGQPTLARGVDQDLRDRIAAYPELAEHLAVTSDRLVVPIQFQDRTLGVLTLGETDRTSFGDEDLAVAVELASRAGTALYNAQRFEAERDMVEVLQRAVLPAELPKLEGLVLAARYLPATVRARVGGDWFDAFRLRDGRIGICVGDVVGHGVNAAACMGQLRNALRVYALDGASTSAVVGALNRFTIDTEVTSYTTLIYAVLDVDSGSLEWTNAGHPPIVKLRSDSTVVLEDGHGTPIGILDQEYGSASTALAEGECAVIYTDGLIERRSETLEDGLTRLARAVDQLRDHPIDDFVDRLVSSVAPEERTDDVCVLVIHRR